MANYRYIDKVDNDEDENNEPGDDIDEYDDIVCALRSYTSVCVCVYVCMCMFVCACACVYIRYKLVLVSDYI